MGFQKTFKALSDPTRREILELLKTGPMTHRQQAGEQQHGKGKLVHPVPPHHKSAKPVHKQTPLSVPYDTGRLWPLSLVGLAVMALAYYRMLSRNISARAGRWRRSSVPG